MTNSFSFMQSLVFVISFAVLCGASKSDACPDLIQRTCRTIAKTDTNVNYNFCVGSLQHVPKSQRTDLQKLGAAAMKVVEANATGTYLLIKKLLKKERKISRKTRLQDCLELYSDAISSMQDAVKYFESKSYDDVNVMVSGAMTDSDTCEDGFAEVGEASPLKKNDADMLKLTAIVLSIVNMSRLYGLG
ncbi:hypothetical protein Sjap_020055 [Stephania japonica]|uniref:Pectinesterase inhibitor domain-containing protein n=1 Tax=Stephania japonica TaxID=461633 RepID=A0AAP0F000_9MAGN